MVKSTQVERIRKKSFLPVDSQVVLLLRRHRSLEDVVHSGSHEDLRERVITADDDEEAAIESATTYEDEDYTIAGTATDDSLHSTTPSRA